MNHKSFRHVTSMLLLVTLAVSALGILPTVRATGGTRPVITGQNPLATDEDTNLTIALGDLTVVDDDSTYPDDFTMEILPGANYSVVSNTGPDSTILPASNFNGALTVPVTVNDGGNASASYDLSVTVNPVNDIPTAVDDPSYAMLEDGSLVQDAAGGVLANDTDVDGPAALTAVLDAGPTFGALASLAADGSFQYDPDPDFCGSDSFSYLAYDGLDYSASATVSITVACVNDPPVTTDDILGDIDEDSGAYFIPLSSLSGNDSPGPMNETGQTLNIIGVSNPVGGTVSINGTNAEFIPTDNYNGPAGFDYIVQDDGTTGGLPDPLTDSGAASFTITPVNDLPTISDISDLIVQRNTPTPDLPFTIWDLETVADSLIVTATSSNKTLVPDANINLAGSGADRTVTVTPANNRSGATTITVTVDDGTDTASDSFLLTVNDQPTVDDIPDQTASEDPAAAVSITFSVDDSETPKADLSVTVESSNTTLAPNTNLVLGTLGVNRTLDISPAADESGVTVITVTVEDADGGQATDTFTLTVSEVNDPPVATNDTVANIFEDSGTYVIAFSTLVGDDSPGPSNESGQTLTVSSVANPTGGTVAIVAGNVEFYPTSNFNGSAGFDYTVQDDGATGGSADPLEDTARVSFTINAVNDDPTISDIADQNIDEDADTGDIAFTIGDLETTAASLVVSGSSSNTTLVPDLNITLGGSGTDRTVNVSPLPDQSGSAVITITVDDGEGGTASDTFTVYVSPLNDQPIADNQSVSVDEESSVSITLTGADADPEVAQTLTFAIDANPTHGALSGFNPATGEVTYTPDPDFFGSDSFLFSVTDDATAGSPGALVSAAGTVSITVNNVNDPPSFDPGSSPVTSLEDHAYSTVWATNISTGSPYESGQTLTFIITANNNPDLFQSYPQLRPMGRSRTHQLSTRVAVQTSQLS
ncbi:MAG: tandem-95 repeat protein [Chloroflexi bacterium]|nr:tandem-95 repeat protein [Chloroflexota bacterium]